MVLMAEGDMLGRAVAVAGPGHGRKLAGRVVLDYEARCLRRRRLVTQEGATVMVDLPQTVSLEEGAALLLEDGRAIAVACAAEPVLRIEGPDLPRLAWHIGNRHCPCEIHAGHLVIRADPVLAEMLARLGARVTRGLAPFRPEGGAYGLGRTFGHAH